MKPDHAERRDPAQAIKSVDPARRAHGSSRSINQKLAVMPMA